MMWAKNFHPFIYINKL